MNWEAISAIAEMIGTVAVVVSLIYLARQLGQNTQAIKSATWQATQDAEQRFDGSIAANSTIAELFDRGTRDGIASLDGVERMQYWVIHKQVLDLYQTHHYHYEKGIIDEDLWQNWVAQLDDVLRSTPNYGRDMVPRLKYLRPSFRKFLEDRLRRHGIEPNEVLRESMGPISNDNPAH